MLASLSQDQYRVRVGQNYDDGTVNYLSYSRWMSSADYSVTQDGFFDDSQKNALRLEIETVASRNNDHSKT